MVMADEAIIVLEVITKFRLTIDHGATFTVEPWPNATGALASQRTKARERLLRGERTRAGGKPDEAGHEQREPEAALIGFPPPAPQHLGTLAATWPICGGCGSRPTWQCAGRSCLPSLVPFMWN